MTGDELALGLGQVEGRAVALSEGGNEEDDEAREAPRGEHVPVGQKAEGPAALGDGDLLGRERAHDHHDRHDRENERQFIADELGKGAHGGEQGVFVPATPAGHEDGELRGGAGGEEVEERGIKLDRDEISAEGQDGEAEQREGHDEDGCEEVEDLVRGVRHDVFLRDRLDGVSKGLGDAPELELAEPGQAGAVGSEAVLQAREELPLGDGGEGEEEAEDRQDDRDREQVVDEPLERRRKQVHDGVAQLERRAFEKGGGRVWNVGACLQAIRHVTGQRKPKIACKQAPTKGEERVHGVGAPPVAGLFVAGLGEAGPGSATPATGAAGLGAVAAAAFAAAAALAFSSAA